MTALPSIPARGARRRLGHLWVLAALFTTLAPNAHAQLWGKRESLSERRRVGMAYDELRGRVVMFGGITGRGTTYTGGLLETWEWANGSWVRRADVTTQPGQVDSSRGMVWNTAEQAVQLVTFPSATAMADLWEWKGRIWQRPSPATRPAFRQHFATAYDETRQRLVMWGGSDASGAQLDVWEFDGTDWEAPPGGPGPSGRNEPGLAWDGVRGKIILFGGREVVGGLARNDMWEWDGVAWTQITPATVPTARNGHSMTWDPVRRRVVLFGGSTSTPGTVFNDTWEWDGTNWSRITTAASPPARTAHASTYHSGRNRLMISCGEFATGLLNDTWEYDGSTWVQVTPPDSPAARADHAAAYDPVRGETILFGGRDTSLLARNDTWRWRGTTWTPLNPATAPAARFDHAMAFDSARGNLVLFGGFTTTPQNDTWLWDGTNWTQANPAARPPARYQHSMAFDASRGRLVLFGGTSTTSGLLADTWEWDGTNWTQITPTTSPLARAEHSMAFDAANNQIVLFGGRINTTTYRQDTWVYSGTTWTDQNTSNVTVRGNCGMDYDPVRQRIYLFAGKSGTSTYAATLLYAWTGTAWTQVNIFTLPLPNARGGVSLVWDAAGRHLMSFGGENATNGKLSETWILTFNTKAAVSNPIAPGTGCTGFHVATILGYDKPILGNANFALDFVPSDTPTPTSPVFFLLSVNQAANGIGFGACTQLVVDPATLFLTSYQLVRGSLASLSLPIPLSLNLAGGQFIAQCMHLDPPTPLNGIAFSVGVRVTMGDY
ncbi:MAG: kelch repeat-containing protein [Planctomycetota bacterium]